MRGFRMEDTGSIFLPKIANHLPEYMVP